MTEKINVGIVGTGLYFPKTVMTADDISKATKGVWTERAVIEKLGIYQKPVPGPDDGTQEMGVRAGLDCLKQTGVDPKEIDVILCIGEERKEYPITTTGTYIQHKIGAVNAWAIDIAQRCCTCVSAMKIAKDMMIADPEINTVMIVGGYRNGDFVDYANPSLSAMYNLGAGAGAMILKKNYDRNLVLGTSIMSDGAFSRDIVVEIGGTVNPITRENIDSAYKSMIMLDEKHMKDGLNAISMPNWFSCIDRALEKSGYTRKDLGYLAILHFKYSMHKYMLQQLGLNEDQTIYLSNYGHIGQVDQILSLQLALEQGKVKDGTVLAMIAAGTGYTWAANIVKWGPM
ncbi:MAG: 3-oxoacyl-ACP synthase [Peptococcia bacterium]